MKHAILVLKSKCKYMQVYDPFRFVVYLSKQLHVCTYDAILTNFAWNFSVCDRNVTNNI